MHPASRKVVLEFPVRALFASGVLTSPQARRKFLLLAQDRWDPERRSAEEVIEGEEAALEVASDATISQEGQTSTPAQDREQGPSRVILQMEKEIVEKGKGWIKIGCETFPLERQNMKWCSDVLDKMISEANVSLALVLSNHAALRSSTDGFILFYDNSKRPSSKRCHWTCVRKSRGRQRGGASTGGKHLRSRIFRKSGSAALLLPELAREGIERRYKV